MKSILLGIAVGLLALLILAGGYFLIRTMNAEEVGQEEPDRNSGSVFPSSHTVTPTQTRSESVATQDGLLLRTYDFIHNGTTFEDPSNAGNYFLAGKLDYCIEGEECPDTHTPSFSILYLSADQSFIVSLNEEPLKDARVAAENYLTKILGLTEAEMCTLRYSVGTTGSVNPQYASMNNLGFSFCPGAVTLP